MPKRIKRKRPITSEQGGQMGMEEYYDYVFPEEAGAAPNLKLLEAAMRWKRQKLMQVQGGADEQEPEQADGEQPQQAQEQQQEVAEDANGQQPQPEDDDEDYVV